MIKLKLSYNNGNKIFNINTNFRDNQFTFYKNIQKYRFGSGPGSTDFDPRVNYYHRLGLNESASEAEIKKAFYSLAKKYHPDSNQDKKLQTSNEEKFKEASNAYEILSDGNKKTQYDDMRKEYKNQFGGSHHGGFKNNESEHTYKYDSQGRRYGSKPDDNFYQSTSGYQKSSQRSSSQNDQGGSYDQDPFKDPMYEQWKKTYQEDARRQYQERTGTSNSNGSGSYRDKYNNYEKERFKDFYNHRQEQRKAYNERNKHQNPYPVTAEQTVLQLFLSFIGFSAFTFLIFGGGPTNRNREAPPVIQQRSSQVPFSNISSIDQTYAPYYTPDGRGNNQFGKVEIRILNNPQAQTNTIQTPQEAHSGAFVAGMPPKEVDYYTKIHSLPMNLEVKQKQDYSGENNVVNKQRGGVIQTQINPKESNIPGQKRKKKKNNFRDKEIEAYARMQEKEKIPQNKSNMSYQQLTRFDVY